MSHELKDVKEYLQHDYLVKDEAPKTTKAAWGKPQVAPVVVSAPSLLEIEAEQQKEKEKIEEQKGGKPGVYQPRHNAGASFSSSTPSSSYSASSPGAYSRPERSDGPGTSFESYNRGPRPHVPVPNHPPFTAYVGNLPFNVTEGELADYFSGLDVKDIRLAKNSDGRSRGFAFVEFESAEGLTSSLSANEDMFSGRKITVEVQPPRAGGDRGYGGSTSSFDREEDKGRWGPSSGSGFASQLGSQAGARGFENRSEGRSYGQREGGYGQREGGYGQREGGSGQREGGGYGQREGGFGASRGEEDRQWRGREASSFQPPVTSQQRPKIDLKPRTVTEEVGSFHTEKSSSEDPFGGALNPEKAKRQAELQAQREAEVSAKHKMTTTTTTTNSGSRYGDRDGQRGQEQSSAPWRSGPRSQEHGEQQQEGGDKYRFNRGQKDQKSTPNPSSNTFSSLAQGGSKW